MPEYARHGCIAHSLALCAYGWYADSLLVVLFLSSVILVISFLLVLVWGYEQGYAYMLVSLMLFVKNRHVSMFVWILIMHL